MEVLNNGMRKMEGGRMARLVLQEVACGGRAAMAVERMRERESIGEMREIEVVIRTQMVERWWSDDGMVGQRW